MRAGGSNDGMAKAPAANAKAELPTVAFSSPKAWESWLSKYHDSAGGVWIKFAKKSSGVDSVTYADALESALCYGWIDGQAKSLDGHFYLQRFTPRARRSKWSKINCGKVEALVAAGRMKAAGLRQVEAAKADGRWEAAYDSPRTAAVPDDLLNALRKNAAAKRFFATLDGRNRYAILHRIQDAKKPETRARRVAQFVTMLAEGRELYP